MMIVPFNTDPAKNIPNTWWLTMLSGGRAVVITRCSEGHIGQLDHHINPDGSVTPSVVCQHEGCTYHEFIQLEDWNCGLKERGQYLTTHEFDHQMNTPRGAENVFDRGAQSARGQRHEKNSQCGESS